MDELEFRFVDHRFDKEQQRVSGYGAVFYDGTPGTEYQLGPNLYERIDKNAFDKSLEESPDDVRLYLMHDRRQPLARVPKTMQVRKDQKGLFFDGKLMNTTLGRDAITMLEEDYIRGASVGMNITKRKFHKEGGRDIVTVTEAYLDHIGLVDKPAYANCTTTLRQHEAWAKSFSLDAAEESVRELLNRLSQVTGAQVRK